MTVLTFPSNPTNGQQYAAPNGVQYVFDGVKWIVESTNSSSGAITNSTQDRVAPLFVDGNNTGITFTYDAATNTMSAAVTAVNGNQLVNGDKTLILDTGGDLTFPSGGKVIGDSQDGTYLQANPGNDGYAGLSSLNGNSWMWTANDGGAYISSSDGATVKSWSFNTDGKLTLPIGGDIVDNNGTTVLGGGTGGGLSVSDFGQGFTDTLDSGKITTSKLYNKNPNPGLNNQYELSVDNGGVVHLPDQSVINGATLKSVAGNYAGITAGPVGKDEDSWMWVDPTGAFIATDYSDNAYTWQFDNAGVLNLPQCLAVGAAVIQPNDTTFGIKLISNGNTFAFGTDGKLTLPTNGTISFGTDNGDNWNVPLVNTVQAALEELAARLTAVENFEIEGGNAYTLASAETIIDGNGA